MIGNKLKSYIRALGFVFLVFIVQFNALAELPPRARAVKLRSAENLVPDSLFKSSKRMEFFSNARSGADDQFKNKIDVRFKKVMIIDPKRKEKKSNFSDEFISLKEIENLSGEFISALKNRENELKKLNEEAE